MKPQVGTNHRCAPSMDTSQSGNIHCPAPLLSIGPCPRRHREEERQHPAFFCMVTLRHIMSSYILLPQATACSFLINLPFIEFPCSSPNANAPLCVSVKSAAPCPPGPRQQGAAGGLTSGADGCFDATVSQDLVGATGRGSMRRGESRLLGTQDQQPEKHRLADSMMPHTG